MTASGSFDNVSQSQFGQCGMKAFAVGVVGLVLSLVSSLGLAGEGKLDIAATEYPPYYGEDLPNGGFLTEIVVEAFKRAGYDAEIKFLPWKRALEESKAGKHDGLFSIWYRKEREEWFVFSDPIPPPTEVGFYKRKDTDISFETFEDLKPLYDRCGQRVCVAAGI